MCCVCVCVCVGDMMYSPDCKHTLSVYIAREKRLLSSQARDPYADHPAWLTEAHVCHTRASLSLASQTLSGEERVWSHSHSKVVQHCYGYLSRHYLFQVGGKI